MALFKSYGLRDVGGTFTREAERREQGGQFATLADFDIFAADFKARVLDDDLRAELIGGRELFKPVSGHDDPERAQAAGLKLDGLYGHSGGEPSTPFGASWLKEIRRQPNAVAAFFGVEPSPDRSALREAVGQRLIDERFEWRVDSVRQDVAQRLALRAPAATVEPATAPPRLSSLDAPAAGLAVGDGGHEMDL